MAKPVLPKNDYSMFGKKATTQNSNSGSASSAGSTMRPMDYANIGLGAMGAVKAITNKKPQLQGPMDLKSVIRPASGDEEGLSRAKQDIRSATRSSLRSIRGQAGSNISAYLRGAQSLHANETNAIRKAEGQNSQMYRQDQNRMYGEMNRDRQVNNMQQNQHIREGNHLNYSEFLRKHNESQNMINSSINYENQRQEMVAGNKQMLDSSNQRVSLMAEMEVNRLKGEYLKAGNIKDFTPEVEEQIRQRILQNRR